jgi:pyridoxine 4-dehydrogenase
VGDFGLGTEVWRARAAPIATERRTLQPTFTRNDEGAQSGVAGNRCHGFCGKARVLLARRGTRPSRWDADCRPKKLKQDLEGSLKRLRLERIDLYQLHTVDPKVPLEVSVETLADMRREGKVRHVGLSNVTVKQIEAARKIVPVVSVQNRYSLADRGSESVLLYCEKHGIAFLPWYPLGDGSALRLSKVKKVAQKLGASSAQVAIAWLLKKSPVMLPIPGTGKLAHLEENLAAAKLDLGDEHFRELCSALT